MALRARLLAHRAGLLYHAVQQSDADPHSWNWLRMLADVQAALTAVEAAGYSLLDSRPPPTRSLPSIWCSA